ncbi:MAG: cobalamin B12-binding domain-containing protein [Verrucomicrobia bacterium]|nr:cobalamin B12-binding domain-containing protein [Verrucomicrobiota bacterium]
MNARRKPPLRILTAVPICDGHDSPIITINLELARHGVEVIYLGYNCPASAIARAAVQEDVHAIGISSYNGGHIAFFDEVVGCLHKYGGQRIPLFGGGGGTITPQDEAVMKRRGVDRIFFAGTPLQEIVSTVIKHYSRPLNRQRGLHGDRKMARAITVAESSKSELRSPKQAPNRKLQIVNRKSFVAGVTGPGGAGKSTLIDELVRRYLQQHPQGRVAVLANDPSHPDSGGAILGDRASMIYAQHDRVFMRSLATRGHLSGLSSATRAALEILKSSGEVDFIFVESVGIGQESDPFQLFGRRRRLVDASLLVMSPYYGGRIQLQKIGLLNGADFVAINKCDQPAAKTAKAEIAERLEANQRGQKLFGTIAARHGDPGVDALYAAIEEKANRQ